jgi:hypothetical protein
MKNLSFLLVSFFLFQAVSFAQPTISFEKTIYDYGIVEYDGNGNCEFKFKNTGDQPLIINDVKSSCGCLVPSYPKEPIKPGNSNVIKARYDTKRLGVFEKTLTGTCNDPKMPQFVLKIKGKVVHIFTKLRTDANEIDLGKISFDEIRSMVFNIQNLSPKKMHVNASLYNYAEGDIFEIKIDNPDNLPPVGESPNKVAYLNEDIDPLLDKCTISIQLKNIYGNAGKFTRKIRVDANTTEGFIEFTIRGEYTGAVGVDSLLLTGTYPGANYEVHYFKNNSLDKIKVFSNSGKLAYERTYNGSYCTNEKRFSYWNSNKNGNLTNETWFREGEVIDKKTY